MLLRRYIPVLFAAVLLSPVFAQETLTLEQCRQMAIDNSPLQIQKANAATVAAFQLDNLKTANLPKITFSGQAAYQSDVFGLPIESPLFNIPTIPKDQYRVSGEITQRIWDGQSDRVRRQQYALEQEMAVAQTDVDVFTLRETVTDLFFKTLLLQETQQILQNAETDLNTRLKQVEAAIAEGVMLRTHADQLRIQLLKNRQQQESTRSDQQTLMELLALWMGRTDTGFSLAAPETNAVPTGQLRPEWKIFELKEKQLDVQRQSLMLKSQPRVEAFAQGGWGRPIPLNAFENGMYGLIGVRAVWMPFDWGVTRRERDILKVQLNNIAAQKRNLELRLNAASLRDTREADKNKALLQQDDAIISLQESIVARADAQVKNGLMTMTDYLAQVNTLTQARITRKTHELQMAMARELNANR